MVYTSIETLGLVQFIHLNIKFKNIILKRNFIVFMTNMVKSGNSQHPNILTMFLQDRSFINQNFVIDHKSFIVKNLLINNSLFYKVTEKCRLHPLKKDFYLKITFLEFIHFRVNILIMFINTYLFEIKFMKINVLYKMLRNVVFVP